MTSIEDRAQAAFDREFEGRSFQVYSIVSDEALTKPASFDDTFAAMERLGATSAMDIREMHIK